MHLRHEVRCAPSMLRENRRERTSVHRHEGLFVEQHVAQHASRVADLLQGTNLGCGRDILAAALPCVNSYLVARSVAVVFRSVCVARSVGVPDDGSPFGLPVCTCCTSQVPAHQTHAGAHLTRRAYMTRTDAVTDTWGRCTCTDVKRWPRLCVVKEGCRGKRGSPCQASHLPTTHGVIRTPSGNAVSQSFDRRTT